MAVQWFFFSRALLFCTCFFFTELVFSNASSVDSSRYTSVTALDKYGQSVQLKHAREAASRHGRLVVAATSSEDGQIVVVSVHKRKQGVLDKGSSKRMAHLLLSRSLAPSSCSYMVCTGVKPDASFLVRAIRDYAKRIWERYDVDGISQERYSQAVSQALLEFMGYDRTKEHLDGVGKVIVTSDRDRGWARPLGVQVILASPKNPRGAPAALTVLEPSGIPFPARAFAMGQQSALVNDALQKRYHPSLSGQKLKDLLVEVVREAFEDQNETTELVVEILNSEGVDVTCIPLRDKQDT